MLDDNEIRQRFFRLVDRLGWSDADVVRELGAPQSNVSKWRSGDRKVPGQYLPTIADRAGETPGYFGPREAEELGRVAKRDLLVIADWLSMMAASLREEAGATSPAEDPPEMDEAGLAVQGIEALAGTDRTGGQGEAGSGEDPAPQTHPNASESHTEARPRGKTRRHRRA